jgi:hypothetical protein
VAAGSARHNREQLEAATLARRGMHREGGRDERGPVVVACTSRSCSVVASTKEASEVAGDGCACANYGHESAATSHWWYACADYLVAWTVYSILRRAGTCALAAGHSRACRAAAPESTVWDASK